MSHRLARVSIALLAVYAAACESVLELDSYRVEPSSVAPAQSACTADADCTAADTCAMCTGVPARDCTFLAGPALDPRALRIGSLLANDPLAPADDSYQRSAILAVEELNAAGGVTQAGDSQARPLALIACDAAQPERAAQQLIQELGVQALLGPLSSQANLDIARTLSIPAGVLSVSPTATAASIGDLSDADLSWTMLPADTHRAALLLQQLSEVEHALSARADHGLRLSIVLPNDATGSATRSLLNQLRWHDMPLSHASNLGAQVMIHEYAGRPTPDQSLLEALAGFAPDVILLSGGPETVRTVLQPLEARLASAAAQPLPQYVFSEVMQSPLLLELASAAATLAPRLRGIDVAATDAARPVLEAFGRSYQQRFNAEALDPMRAAAAYDAVYGVAYGLVASGQSELQGYQIARGMRQLAHGDAATSGGARIAEDLQLLRNSRALDVMGTLDRLEWDDAGMRKGGKLEVWCVQARDGSAQYVSSGASYAVASGELSAATQPCGGDVSVPDRSMNGMPAADGSKPAGPTSVSPPQAAPLPDAAPAKPGMSNAGTAPARMQIGLVAQYSPVNRDPHDSVISPGLRIENRSATSPIPLTGLELRYYFSNEQAMSCPDDCVVEGFYAGLQPSGQRVNVRRSYVSLGQGTAAYLSFSFGPMRAELARGEYVELQQQFHTTPYQTFDETDDYSFSAARAEYTDSKRVSIYREGELVWGEPPP